MIGMSPSLALLYGRVFPLYDSAYSFAESEPVPMLYYLGVSRLAWRSGQLGVLFYFS